MEKLQVHLGTSVVQFSPYLGDPTQLEFSFKDHHDPTAVGARGAFAEGSSSEERFGYFDGVKLNHDADDFFGE